MINNIINNYEISNINYELLFNIKENIYYNNIIKDINIINYSNDIINKLKIYK